MPGASAEQESDSTTTGSWAAADRRLMVHCVTGSVDGGRGEREAG